jgi:hypothetical protein
MSHRFFALLNALAVVSAVTLVAPGPVAGQSPSSAANPIAAAETWTPPRTPDGQPDMQGIWTNATITQFERPSEFAGKEFLTEKEAAEYEDRAARVGLGLIPRYDPVADLIGSYNDDVYLERGGKVVSTRRTSLIVDPPDGKLPLTPEASKKLAYNRAHRDDSYMYQNPMERCITRGVPFGMFPGGYNNGYLILQTPGYVVIAYETVHETRIIPLDGSPHLEQGIRQWHGDSRGRWEGNTLVIDITNYNNKAALIKDNGGVAQSEAQHVVERLTLIDANTIIYEATVEDPNAYTRPWKVTFPFHRDQTYQIFEESCHEGNKDMTFSLSAGRAADEEAKKTAKKATK